MALTLIGSTQETGRIIRVRTLDNNKNVREGSDPENDRENFTKLSQELAADLHAAGKLLTAAMSADNKRADVC